MEENMDNSKKLLFSELENHINDDSLYVYEEKLIDALENSDHRESYIEEIFKIMERYPLIDWGMPGAFVVFLESFDNETYEKNLLNSLSRQPTLQTVWMLNRQINSVGTENKEPFLKVLREIACNSSLERDIAESAKNFVEYQDKVAKSIPSSPPKTTFNSLEQIFNMFKFIPKDK